MSLGKIKHGHLKSPLLGERFSFISADQGHSFLLRERLEMPMSLFWRTCSFPDSTFQVLRTNFTFVFSGLWQDLQTAKYMKSLQRVTLPRDILMQPNLITQKVAKSNRAKQHTSASFSSDPQFYSIFSLLPPSRLYWRFWAFHWPDSSLCLTLGMWWLQVIAWGFIWNLAQTYPVGPFHFCILGLGSQPQFTF